MTNKLLRAMHRIRAAMTVVDDKRLPFRPFAGKPGKPIFFLVSFIQFLMLLQMEMNLKTIILTQVFAFMHFQAGMRTQTGSNIAVD